MSDEPMTGAFEDSRPSDVTWETWYRTEATCPGAWTASILALPEVPDWAWAVRP